MLNCLSYVNPFRSTAQKVSPATKSTQQSQSSRGASIVSNQTYNPSDQINDRFQTYNPSKYQSYVDRNDSEEKSF